MILNQRIREKSKRKREKTVVTDLEHFMFYICMFNDLVYLSYLQNVILVSMPAH